MENVTLFSSGCTINAFVNEVEDSEAVVVFICDELGQPHTDFMENPAIKKLSARFTSIFFDARGCGESAYPLAGKISANALCDDIKCVVDYSKHKYTDKPVYLFTASYGTIATLLFVQKYGEGIEKLIIDSPILWPSCPDMVLELMDTWKKNAKRTFSPELAEEIHKHHSTPEGLAELMKTEQARDFVANNQPVKKGSEYFSFYYAMQEFIPTCDLRLIVHDMNVQTLFLVGLKDKLCPPPISIETVKVYKNPAVYLSEFKDFSHKVYLMDSNEFARICTEFYYG